MKVEIKERNEHNREELRCRDNNLQELMKKREEELVASLQHRDRVERGSG